MPQITRERSYCIYCRGEVNQDEPKSDYHQICFDMIQESQKNLIAQQSIAADPKYSSRKLYLASKFNWLNNLIPSPQLDQIFECMVYKDLKLGKSDQELSFILAFWELELNSNGSAIYDSFLRELQAITHPKWFPRREAMRVNQKKIKNAQNLILNELYNLETGSPTEYFTSLPLTSLQFYRNLTHTFEDFLPQSDKTRIDLVRQKHADVKIPPYLFTRVVDSEIKKKLFSYPYY